MSLKRIAGGVNAARGFLSAAAACGIKRTGPLRSDLCIVASEAPATAAGVFTTNLVKAAPVLLSRRHLDSGKARAVLLNRLHWPYRGSASAAQDAPRDP
jgi:glutamate N-acetyltransferase/amino-acid N-acetyltransferase